MDLNILSLGLYKSSITKVLIASSIAWYTIINLFLNKEQYVNLCLYNPEKALKNFEVWRFLISKFGFHQSHALFLGVLLLFNFKVFEKRSGSKDFLSFIFGTWLISTILEITLTVLKWDSFSPGMHWLIFAMSVRFYHEIPQIETFHLFGPIHANQKTVTYALILQFGLSVNLNITVATGFLAGILYQLNVCYIKKWLTIPNVIYFPLSNFFDIVVGSTPPQFKLTGATLEVQRQMQMDDMERRLIQGTRVRQGQNRGGFFPWNTQRNSARGHRQPASRVDEAILQRLMDMGFQRNAATNALIQSNNNLDTATTLLLAS